MALAIFDLDNTLIQGDSDHAWGEFIVENKLVDSTLFRAKNDIFYRQYQEGTLDIFEYLEFSLKVLTLHSFEDMMKWREKFYEQIFKSMMLPKATKLLAHHRKQGDYLLIITATNLFVTAPAKQLLAVDDIIAPIPELINNRYTGGISGIPSFQEGKVTRLHSWLANSRETLKGSYFYSDSHNDLPLLNIVETPVVVDADEKLLAAAATNNWQSISLRD